MFALGILTSLLALAVVYHMRKKAVVYRGFQTYYLILAVLCVALSVVAFILLG